MRVLAHISMVMNLDKCIGCHTCSITCKNTWTNRPGAEYMWWNNVETRPGIGYPRRWEDQERYKGGWELRNGRLRLRIGGKISRLLRIFYNPYLPTIDDYYEPWTYDYERLIESEQGEQPVAKPRSLITGDEVEVRWGGPNWDDDLAGSPEIASQDPNLASLEEEIKLEFERTFMFYLPGYVIIALTRHALPHARQAPSIRGKRMALCLLTRKMPRLEILRIGMPVQKGIL